jgi:hypothetical protein
MTLRSSAGGNSVSSLDPQARQNFAIARLCCPHSGQTGMERSLGRASGHL